LFQLWTNEKSREFIAAEYPWFLETFDGYKYPIQRADSIRYFVLAYYGGIYIDLDVCIYLAIVTFDTDSLTLSRAAIVA
jgi:mannosyltransferase OCH1-like enzyme